jgi:hypothetical protein
MGGGGNAPHQKFKNKNSGMIVELKGCGSQFVMPPSIWPGTFDKETSEHRIAPQPYRMGDGSNFPPPVSELPTIDESHLEALEGVLEPHLYRHHFKAPDDAFPRRSTPLIEAERGRYEAYANAAFEGEVEALKKVTQGGRNDALFIATCKLGTWVHAGFIDKSELVKGLLGACGEDGNQLSIDDGESSVESTIESGLRTCRHDLLPLLADRSSTACEPHDELSPEDEVRHLLRWLRRYLRDTDEVGNALLALCRKPIGNIEEIARDWFKSLPRKVKPKDGFEVLWHAALAKPLVDGDPSYEKLRQWAENAKAKERAEVDRCALLTPAEYQLERHEVAARLGYYNVTEFDKVVNQRKREIRNEGDVSTKNNQAELIVKLVLEHAELFHTPDKVPYADVRRDSYYETMRIGSNEFAEYLQFLFFENNNERSCTETALNSAIQQIAALAKFRGSEREVHKRVAHLKDAIFVDLGTEDRKAVKITKEGWTLAENPEAKFSRSRNTRALLKPDASGTLGDLDSYLDLQGNNRILSIAWMTYAALGKPPYPVLQITGPAGSAKSTLATKIAGVIDPRKPTLRIKPKEARDIFIGAHHSHLLAYDNLSGLSPQLSDILCSIATGGGITSRELYTNDAEHVLEEVNPVLLTGVSQVITRQDLMDRTVNITLPEIDDKKRRTPEEIAQEAEELAQRVFGCLLNIIVHGLNQIDNVEPIRLPRMAGFAKWGMAIEGALGCPFGTFEDAYEQNRDEALKELAEANPVAIAIGRFMRNKTEWSGAAEELLAQLTPHHRNANNDYVDRYWPRTPNVLSRRINGELVPILRNMGIRVERGEGEKRRHFALSWAEKDDTRGQC